MKKILIGALALTAIVGCSKSKYLGQHPQKVEKLLPIEIGSNVEVPTKATEGAAAAELLGNRFYVWGYKHGGAERDEGEIFKQIPVNYTQDEGWSYVTDTQSLRYWDSNASGYDFIAISDKNEITDNSKAMEFVTAKEDVYTNGFSIASVTADQLANIHITPLQHINNTAYTSPVEFEFSNPAAKLRVGFLNAIPGHHVTIDEFTLSGGTKTPHAVLSGKFHKSAAYLVAANGTISINGGPVETSDIILGDHITSEESIGTSLTSATYDKEDASYSNVLPVMENGQEITMIVKYRMISGHDIHAITSTVKIPADYAKWQPNYAYTYLFKITDNDLHPITFNAVVKDPENQETCTTIDGDNPVNITVWGADTNVTEDGGVKAGTKVYVSVKDVPATEFTVSTGHTTDVIDGSNAGTKITSWTSHTPLGDGRYEFTASEVGYYAIRVEWSQIINETTVTRDAYMVIQVIG